MNGNDVLFNVLLTLAKRGRNIFDLKMLIKSKCEHCQAEFEDEGFEKTVFCPACGHETHIRPVGSYFAPHIDNVAQHDGLILASYTLAILFPLIGFFMGIYLLLKSQHGHGLSAMALSCFSSAVWYLVIFHFR